MRERVVALRAKVNAELEPKLKILREEEEKLQFGHYKPEKKIRKWNPSRKGNGYHHKIKGWRLKAKG